MDRKLKPGQVRLQARDTHGNQIGIMLKYTADSTNISWVGYPDTGEPTLFVQFKGGARYAYLGVSRQRVIALARAKSAGKYLNRVIKPTYDAVKIG